MGQTPGMADRRRRDPQQALRRAVILAEEFRLGPRPPRADPDDPAGEDAPPGREPFRPGLNPDDVRAQIAVLAELGIREICLVHAPGEPEDLLARLVPADAEVRLTPVVEEQPKGTAHALAAAAETIGPERFLLLDAATGYPREALLALREVPGAGVLGFDRAALAERSNLPEEVLRGAPVIAADSSWQLRNVIENPDGDTFACLGPEAPVALGAWVFTASVFEASTRIEPSVRGRFEILDAVRLLVCEGEPFAVVPVKAGVQVHDLAVEGLEDAEEASEAELSPADR